MCLLFVLRLTHCAKAAKATLYYTGLHCTTLYYTAKALYYTAYYTAYHTTKPPSLFFPISFRQQTPERRHSSIFAVGRKRSGPGCSAGQASRGDIPKHRCQEPRPGRHRAKPTAERMSRRRERAKPSAHMR